MTIVLQKRGVTINLTEQETRNQSKCALDADNLNLYQEKMQCTYASYLVRY